jgi:hypothetical protein
MIPSTLVPERRLALLDTSCVIDFPDQMDELAQAAAVSALTIDNQAAYAVNRNMNVALVDTNYNQYSPWLNTFALDTPCGYEGTNNGILGGWSWQKHSPP